MDAEHRNTLGTGVEYGTMRAAGRVKSCRRSSTPPLMSPPMQLALPCSTAAVVNWLRARMQSP
ncbi:MAG TPA: hypothetical protein VMP01_06110, partial [Pirellulaceae bacterium]|nr:hypothetical protein [Pirellulaceae bacterium]